MRSAQWARLDRLCSLALSGSWVCRQLGGMLGRLCAPIAEDEPNMLRLVYGPFHPHAEHPDHTSPMVYSSPFDRTSDRVRCEPCLAVLASARFVLCASGMQAMNVRAVVGRNMKLQGEQAISALSGDAPQGKTAGGSALPSVSLLDIASLRSVPKNYTASNSLRCWRACLPESDCLTPHVQSCTMTYNLSKQTRKHQTKLLGRLKLAIWAKAQAPRGQSGHPNEQQLHDQRLSLMAD